MGTTIEERAKAIVTENGRFPFDEHARHRYSDLVQFAAEQDAIARAEEREECIRAAQDWYKKLRNEPKNSQWYKQVLYDCAELRNFIDRRRGTCDSYVTDTLHEAIETERARCINAAKQWLMDFLGETDRNHPELESLQKTMEEFGV